MKLHRIIYIDGVTPGGKALMVRYGDAIPATLLMVEDLPNMVRAHLRRLAHPLAFYAGCRFEGWFYNMRPTYRWRLFDQAGKELL